ncbi:MAG: hypothetical protein Q8P32_01865 [Candidatus Komeilibacteria bacterium]|nr:hypothetical protein [Candidatus Komeilibacteria bacterium]
MSEFLEPNRNWWRIYLVYPLIAAVLAVGLTLLQPLEYRANSQILVIHKILPNLDAYSAARASEKLSQNLAEIIGTASFVAVLQETQPIVPLNFLEVDEAKKRQQWERKVEARAVNSLLEISVYDPVPQNAVNLNYAIIQTLLAQGDEFHGGGENIRLKLVNPPLSSRYPARPNFLLNLILAGLTGLALAYLHIYLNFNRSLK